MILTGGRRFEGMSERSQYLLRLYVRRKLKGANGNGQHDEEPS